MIRRARPAPTAAVADPAGFGRLVALPVLVRGEPMLSRTSLTPPVCASRRTLRYAGCHFHVGASSWAVHNLAVERTAFGGRSPLR